MQIGEEYKKATLSLLGHFSFSGIRSGSFSHVPNDSALAVSVPMASAYVFHRSLGVFGLGGMCSLGFGGLGISGRLFCSAGIGGVGAVARAWAAHAPVALAAVESAWLAVDWVNGFELNSFGH